MTKKEEMYAWFKEMQDERFKLMVQQGCMYNRPETWFYYQVDDRIMTANNIHGIGDHYNYTDALTLIDIMFNNITKIHQYFVDEITKQTQKSPQLLGIIHFFPVHFNKNRGSVLYWYHDARDALSFSDAYFYPDTNSPTTIHAIDISRFTNIPYVLVANPFYPTIKIDASITKDYTKIITMQT